MAAIFDYQGSLERMGGDEQLFCEMVGFLVADGRQWLKELRTALARGDATVAHRSAHTLKGLVSNFGAQTAQSAAFRVEQLARDPVSLPQAIAALPQLEAALEELETALAPYHHPPDVAAH
jgi:two-component system sensor histidine kinase/response regulator